MRGTGKPGEEGLPHFGDFGVSSVSTAARRYTRRRDFGDFGVSLYAKAT